MSRGSSGTITYIDPDAVVEAESFTLDVYGSGFAALNTSVVVTDVTVATTFVSSTHLRASVPGSAIPVIGTYQVWVQRTGYDPSNSVTLNVAANLPTISSWQPAELIVGKQKTMTLGSEVGGFLQSTTVTLWTPAHPYPGTPEVSNLPTAYQSSGLISFTVLASYVTAPGHFWIQAFNDNVDGNVVELPVYNPQPTISSLSPSTVTWNHAAFTLTVGGSDFVSGSTIRWSGGSLTTTFVSSSSLSATVPASYVAGDASGPPRAVPITVYTSNGGTSNALTFWIGTAAGQPTVTLLTPSSRATGSSGFSLQVDGTNFQSYSVVRWAGADRPTSRSSATRVTAQIYDTDLQSPGNVPVSVYTSPPGGGTSSALQFAVVGENPVPVVATLDPPSIVEDSAQFALSVRGSGFASTSVVLWNGAERATTYVSSTELSATILAADVTTPGTAQVIVRTPAPGGGDSNGVQFAVVAAGGSPVPKLDSISPTEQDVGYGSTTWSSSTSYSVGAVVNYLTFVYVSLQGGNINHVPSSSPTWWQAVKLTVQGDYFADDAIIYWGSSAMTTDRSQIPYTLSAQVAYTRFSAEGEFLVTVFNPAPGGGTSAAIPFAVNNPAANPVPVFSGVTPKSVARGSDPPTLVVSGSRFVPESVVLWDGNERAATYVTSGRLELALTSQDVAVLNGIAVRINPRAQASVHSSAARSLVALDDGDVQRPAVTVGSGSTGLYRVGTSGDLGVGVAGAEVGRFGAPRAAGYSGGFATSEADRFPPWIEPEVVASAATTISTTGATELTGTSKTITPACDVRVEIKACFDVRVVTVGGFIGELWIGNPPAARPERIVYVASAVGDRSTVLQVWNLVLPGGQAATVKLTGKTNGVGSFVLDVHTKWSLIAVGRY